MHVLLVSCAVKESPSLTIGAPFELSTALHRRVPTKSLPLSACSDATLQTAGRPTIERVCRPAFVNNSRSKPWWLLSFVAAHGMPGTLFRLPLRTREAATRSKIKDGKGGAPSVDELMRTCIEPFLYQIHRAAAAGSAPTAAGNKELVIHRRLCAHSI